MRVVKDPKERRKEIMDMAANLFLSKGYEETSINLIVNQLGVAKGTFYHYFQSKEEILEAILEEYISKFADWIDNTVNENSMNAYEKLIFVFKHIFSNNNGAEHLTRHVEDKKNARLHQVMDEKFHEKFYPIILGILKQGIEERIFNVDYPEEITEILLFGIRAYMHVHLPNFTKHEYAQRKFKALEELFNKVLAMDETKYRIKLI
jgi:AcrR family transcriptional regulator